MVDIAVVTRAVIDADHQAALGYSEVVTVDDLAPMTPGWFGRITTTAPLADFRPVFSSQAHPSRFAPMRRSSVDGATVDASESLTM